ncbi:MAG: winged helix DNA-binding domain-containing protein [Actinobacteria bacterium]|nr:winged helix DNA-binding domain-containing protein [Actinomycetota bacterium]
MRAIPLERARRIALGAQGFATPRPGGRVDVRHLRRVLGRNGVVQLDSVNVAARAHYLPFFSRLGPYDTEHLDAWLWRSGENFEHWGHMASVMPVALHPALRFRMERHPWRRVQALVEERPGFVDEVLAFIAEHGPVSVSDLDSPGTREEWWGWSDGRVALDWLYMSGQTAVHHRDRQFMLHFDLPERVLPAAVLSAPTPPFEQQVLELVRVGARAQGIGTAADIADQFRLKLGEARPAIATLVASGELTEVRVEGWSKPAYLHRDAVTPRSIPARALLSPFDPVVWFRDRAERLFDFHYRIEIYTPKEKRVHGYYVLPFLLGDRITARVDLKSDRPARVLRVQGTFVEPGNDPLHVARELAAELRTFASWQGLDDVAVVANGDLAGELARAV